MHPELLNNSLFLRYYEQWQRDPTSIVFAPIAEFFLRYGMIDEARLICREGLKRHPDLVSGRIVMAKVHLKRGNWEEAEDELRAVMAIVPTNSTAQAIMEEIAALREREGGEGAVHAGRAFAPLVVEPLPAKTPLEVKPSWQTATMAAIFASQGHVEQARDIYESILQADPENEAAQQGLAALEQNAG